ncbi:MAG: hypothetical protein IT365_25450 [Candidatus Hydrogenedentes bacterium]|nr:hypothetical protein [Candidatus Hydrogenedentota bacterium]
MRSETRTKATVTAIKGDKIIVLLRLNEHGETRLCAVDKGLWTYPDVQLGQEVTVSWDKDNLAEPPIIQANAAEPSPQLSEVVVHAVRSVLGFRPGDKVLIVQGQNSMKWFDGIAKVLDERAQCDPASSQWIAGLRREFHKFITLKSAGWGEYMMQPALDRDLHTIGIRPRDIDRILCGPGVAFDPQDYADHHIIFVGSTKSNSILREYYWNRLGLSGKYEFRDTDLALLNGDKAHPKDYYPTKEHIPDASDGYNAISITDHFLLAKVPNPDSPPGKKRYCVIVAGVGTIGTGYAGLVPGGQQSSRILHQWFRDKTFDIVGQVAMDGWFDPKSDPVRCVFDGQKPCNVELLPNARSSPRVSDPESAEVPCTEEAVRSDLEDDPLP